MDKLLKFYINGEWVDPISTDRMPVLNPASVTQVGEVALGGEADVDRAVAAATAAFGQFSLSTNCLLYTSPSPRDRQKSRMPSSA